jgi:glutathione S-transferase
VNRPLLVIGNRNYSSWSLRGWLAMRKAGAEFDERRLPMDTDEFRKTIMSLSPTGRVPVLLDGEMCIWDSLAIGEYANDRWAGGRLLPADPSLRGLARAVIAEMHAGFSALRSGMPMNCRARGRQVPVDAELQADIERIFAIWEECLERSGGPWLFGEFTLADAAYAPVALRFTTYGVSGPPAVQDYVAMVLADPDVAEWMRQGAAETEVIEADEAGI